MKDQVRQSFQSMTKGSAEGTIEAVFRFPAGLPVFAGHFPGAPILPGVFLVEAFRTIAEMHLGASFRVEALREAKFTAPVRPGEVVRIVAAVSAAPDAPAVEGRAWSGAVEVARVALRLLPRGPEAT